MQPFNGLATNISTIAHFSLVSPFAFLPTLPTLRLFSTKSTISRSSPLGSISLKVNNQFFAGALLEIPLMIGCTDADDGVINQEMATLRYTNVIETGNDNYNYKKLNNIFREMASKASTIRWVQNDEASSKLQSVNFGACEILFAQNLITVYALSIRRSVCEGINFVGAILASSFVSHLSTLVRPSTPDNNKLHPKTLITFCLINGG